MYTWHPAEVSLEFTIQSNMHALNLHKLKQIHSKEYYTFPYNMKVHL